MHGGVVVLIALLYKMFMRYPDLTVVGECFEPDLGSLAPNELKETLGLLMNSVSINKNSENLQNPSCIALTPTVVVDEMRFIIQAWHETNGQAGSKGVLAKSDSSFMIGYQKDILFIQNEEGISYPLDDESAVFIRNIAEKATRSYLDSL